MRYTGYMNRLALYGVLLFSAGIVRFVLTQLLSLNQPSVVQCIASIIILALGALFILKQSAGIIEETTEVLSERTKLAGGLLQAIGTAFPDMILGIIAATISVRLKSTDTVASLNYAVIASATTFGSNIYNIGHASWCVFRQNLANIKNHTVLMFPFFPKGGEVKPIAKHEILPTPEEASSALQTIHHLSLLTAVVAISMVIFGKLPFISKTIGEVYQLTQPIAIIIFLLSVLMLYRFRKTKRPQNPKQSVQYEENYYRGKSTWILLGCLGIAGIAILLSAESMIRAIQTISDLFRIPLFVVGTASGIIGCLGEMIVIHNFSTQGNGRLGDALTGVVMDNIVTIMGASIVAMIGGIFLGGRSLLLLFVLILMVNTTLLWQVSVLQEHLLMMHQIKKNK
jgi:hypothetical protein